MLTSFLASISVASPESFTQEAQSLYQAALIDHKAHGTDFARSCVGQP